MWTVFNLAQFVFTNFFVYETRGKTVEQIDYLFSGLPVEVGSPKEKEVEPEEIQHLETTKGSEEMRV